MSFPGPRAGGTMCLMREGVAMTAFESRVLSVYAAARVQALVFGHHRRVRCEEEGCPM